MDASAILYHKYFALGNKQVVVTLKTGEVLHGQLVGFYKGEQVWGEPYIRAWHWSPIPGLLGLGLIEAGEPLGKIIEQAAIAQIYFNEDQSIMDF